MTGTLTLTVGTQPERILSDISTKSLQQRGPPLEYGLEQLRNQREPDRHEPRLSLHVSCLGQTVRFLPSNVMEFHSDAPSS